MYGLHHRRADMYLIGFATDYDGTLAHHGTVDEATVDALERLRVRLP